MLEMTQEQYVEALERLQYRVQYRSPPIEYAFTLCKNIYTQTSNFAERNLSITRETAVINLMLHQLDDLHESIAAWEVENKPFCTNIPLYNQDLTTIKNKVAIDQEKCHDRLRFCTSLKY